MKRKELFKLKKSLRITALILSALLLCSVFTGCDMLDEMRRAHAVKSENDNIILNGNEYKYVPFGSPTALFNLDLVPTSDIYVTEPDVPVLLSEGFYEFYGYVSEDGKFLYVYDEDYNSIYYCRTDVYDTLIERLDEPFVPEVLAYAYSYYDYENDVDIYDSYILTEEEQNAVEDVLRSVEPVQQENYSVYQAESYCDLYECSEDLIFNRMVLSIEYKNGRYAVAREIGNGITEVHRVPDELVNIFAGIMASQFAADSIYLDFFEDEI